MADLSDKPADLLPLVGDRELPEIEAYTFDERLSITSNRNFNPP